MKKKRKDIAVLGMNRRNVEYIYVYNDRKYYNQADDKVISKELLEKNNIPTPRLIKVYNYFFELRSFTNDLVNKSGFVIKPAHGKGGGGIIIIDDFKNNHWITSSGNALSKSDLYQHATAILSGVYSLDNKNDSILIEEKIQLHDTLERITYKGIPDIRVIIFKKVPALAMMRIPTKQSDGKANLHSGGIGVGINIQTGKTTINDSYAKTDTHPDTGEKLSDIQIPYWDEILNISKKVQDIVPLMYMGIDFIIDKRYGPQILELNVRPGLEIQNINGKGLNSILKKIGGNYA